MGSLFAILAVRKFWAELYVIRYWKGIALGVMGVVLLLLSTNYVYEMGVASADLKWVLKHDSEVTTLKKKIADLEALSITTHEKDMLAQAELSQRLGLTLKNTVITPRDAVGKVLKCGGQVIEVFLGAEFSEKWNNMNTEGNAK